MERIVYNKTLDVHKNGVQFTLQGFETADNMARRIVISLMASGDTIDFPLEQIKAIMYVTTPSATEPSIHDCDIKDNNIIYDVLPITEEGITEMQIKLIETRPDGANGVLAAPKFAVEVEQSNDEDGKVEQTTTYTALENAVAMAKGVYDTRVVSIEIDSDCNFIVHYADGTVYETDVLKEVLLKGEALLSQSYARGNTGIRIGEDTDNSMYYSNVSRSASAEADRVIGEASDLLEEALKHGVYTAFSINFDSGEVEYISPSYSFNVDKETGELEAIGESYTPEENIEHMVTEWLDSQSTEIANLNSIANGLNADVINIHSAMREQNETIAGLQAADDTINVAMGSLSYNTDDKIASVNKSVQTNTTNIGELQTQVNDIIFGNISRDDSISAIGGKISSMQGEINTLDAGLKATAQQINTNASDIDGLESRIGSAETNITSLQNKFIITSDSNASSLKNAPNGSVWIKPLS